MRRPLGEKAMAERVLKAHSVPLQCTVQPLHDWLAGVQMSLLQPLRNIVYCALSKSPMRPTRIVSPCLHACCRWTNHEVVSTSVEWMLLALDNWFGLPRGSGTKPPLSPGTRTGCDWLFPGPNHKENIHHELQDHVVSYYHQSSVIAWVIATGKFWSWVAPRFCIWDYALGMALP